MYSGVEKENANGTDCVEGMFSIIIRWVWDSLNDNGGSFKVQIFSTQVNYSIKYGWDIVVSLSVERKLYITLSVLYLGVGYNFILLCSVEICVCYTLWGC